MRWKIVETLSEDKNLSVKALSFKESSTLEEDKIHSALTLNHLGTGSDNEVVPADNHRKLLENHFGDWN